MTTYAGGPGALPVGMTPGEPQGRGTAFWVRTVLAAGIGLVSVALLALAGVVTVFAVVVASPDHPGRSFAAVLSVPELRHDAAESLVADVEEAQGRAFEPGTRTVLVRASEQALGDPDVLAALADVPLEGGDLDPTTYVAAIARELGAQARATDDPQARRVLSTFSEELPGLVEDSLAGTGPEGDSLDFATGLGRVRHYGLVVAAVVAGLGLVALLVAVAVAVHRGLTAALVASAALVVTALVLAPGEWLLGLGDGLVGALARVVAAAGEFAGAGLVWSLLLASLVPPTLWWAVRSARRTA